MDSLVNFPGGWSVQNWLPFTEPLPCGVGGWGQQVLPLLSAGAGGRGQH
jgi:hypothetical protein